MVSSISGTGSTNSYHISQLQKKQQPSAEDVLNKIDSNADGSVSKNEFITNRPQEVSEEQAKQMWSQIDSSNAGSLTGSQFITAMEKVKPPQGPPPNDLQSSSDSSSSVSSLSSDSISNNSTNLIKALLNAIKQYTEAEKQTSSTTADDKLTSSVNELFSKIDTDGDGSISETSPTDELVNALLKAIKEYTTANQSGFPSAGSMATASMLSTKA